MKNERRAAERVKVSLEVSWQVDDEPQRGTISDISTNGCFVLCSGDVENGRRVAVELRVPRRAKALALRGEVVNHHDEIGFAMRFTEVGKTEAALLQKLIASAASININS